MLLLPLPSAQSSPVLPWNRLLLLPIMGLMLAWGPCTGLAAAVAVAAAAVVIADADVD